MLRDWLRKKDREAWREARRREGPPTDFDKAFITLGLILGLAFLFWAS